MPLRQPFGVAQIGQVMFVGNGRFHQLQQIRQGMPGIDPIRHIALVRQPVQLQQRYFAFSLLQ